MLTSAQFPFSGPYSVGGLGNHRGPTALALKRAMKRAGIGFTDTSMDQLDDRFNLKLEKALDAWDPGANGYGRERWIQIRSLKIANGQYALDAFSRKLVVDEMYVPPPIVPALGPISRGGRSILQQDLTHATDGIPLFPAFDDAFYEGASVIAPEDLKVTKQSSSRPGDAFYGQGVSKIRYWFGHLRYAPATGRYFAKGTVMGYVGANNIGGGPHCHCGINVELLWGSGRQLAHHTDYSHGAVLVGAQLKAHAQL